MEYSKKIKVYPPGTVANMVCGFDVLGFALYEPCDEMEMELVEERGVFIAPDPVYHLPVEPEENVAGAPLLAIIEDLQELQG